MNGGAYRARLRPAPRTDLFAPNRSPPSRRTDIFMTLAYGGTAKEAGLDGHVIRVKKLEETAVKVIPAKKR